MSRNWNSSMSKLSRERFWNADNILNNFNLVKNMQHYVLFYLTGWTRCLSCQGKWDKITKYFRLNIYLHFEGKPNKIISMKFASKQLEWTVVLKLLLISCKFTSTGEGWGLGSESRERCIVCGTSSHGHGRLDCNRCDTKGRVACSVCDSYGQLKCFIQLSVSWWVHA